MKVTYLEQGDLGPEWLCLMSLYANDQGGMVPMFDELRNSFGKRPYTCKVSGILTASLKLKTAKWSL